MLWLECYQCLAWLNWITCSGFFQMVILIILTVMINSYFLAFARFCEAILDYLADEQRAAASGITADQFEGEVFSAYDTLFNVWLQSKDARVNYNTIFVNVSFSCNV